MIFGRLQSTDCCWRMWCGTSDGRSSLLCCWSDDVKLYTETIAWSCSLHLHLWSSTEDISFFQSTSMYSALEADFSALMHYINSRFTYLLEPDVRCWWHWPTNRFIRPYICPSFVYFFIYSSFCSLLWDPYQIFLPILLFSLLNCFYLKHLRHWMAFWWCAVKYLL